MASNIKNKEKLLKYAEEVEYLQNRQTISTKKNNKLNEWN